MRSSKIGSRKNLIVQLTFVSVVLNVLSIFLTCVNQSQGNRQSERLANQESIAFVNPEKSGKEKEYLKECSESFLKIMPV